MDERRILWCSWDAICTAKDFGGLGFRDFECFNKALLAKQGWRILSATDSLLATCLQLKYYPRTTFLKATLGHTPSFSWRNILAGREILTKGICWTVRNRCSIYINGDPWLPNSPGFKAPTLSATASSILLVRELMNDDGDRWNEALIFSIFPTATAREITSIPISLTFQRDCLRWKHNKDGRFTVKSGYWVAKNLKDVISSKPSSSSNNHKTWRWIWSLNVPPKVRVFLWRCMKGVLQTKHNLQGRGIHLDPICSRCGLAQENVEHVLRDCSWSSFFWQVSVLRLCIAPATLSMSIQDWILAITHNQSMEFICIFVMLLWIIWKARNCAEFERRNMTFIECFNSAAILLHEYQSLNKIPLQPRLSISNCSRWQSPPSGWFKLNSDASITTEGCAGLGGVIRNSEQQVIKIFSFSILSCFDIELAEAIACRHGVKTAADANIRCLVVEIDNQALVHRLEGGIAPLSPVGTVIADILHLAAGFQQISFKWTRRSGNVLAHKIARFACNESSPMEDIDFFPYAVRRIVMADVAFYSQ